eukprot:3610488-Amphidinium_carterae.1
MPPHETCDKGSLSNTSRAQRTTATRVTRPVFLNSVVCHLHLVHGRLVLGSNKISLGACKSQRDSRYINGIIFSSHTGIHTSKTCPSQRGRY